MKKIFFGIAIGAISLVACNTQSGDKNRPDSSSVPAQQNTPVATNGNQSATPISRIVNDYLELKNALANDNGKNAADAGKALADAFKNFDQGALSDDKKKTFQDIQDDAHEHAEHISMNGDNIAHQREHFEILSKDVYDLVKTFGAGQTLYKEYCPMYDNNKGAYWLSEIKEIKNPYFGKEMLTCGEVQETLQ